MRTITQKQIENAVFKTSLKANFVLRKDALDALKNAVKKEKKQSAKNMLKVLIENAKIARSKKIAICQDTGMVCVFCEIGTNVKISGDIKQAINNGIKKAYKEGFLRKSVVDDPLLRKNTNTNTPASINFDFINGSRIKISLIPKGFGSENASFVKMFNPTTPAKEIIGFIVKTVKEAGASACPPLVLGIGMGGTLDKAAVLSKKALLIPIAKKNPKNHIKALEKEILEKINKTNIGPMGLGGKTTCLGANILTYPTHIAGLPVCVNVCCHALRSASVII